jgi:hypothetical protein
MKVSKFPDAQAAKGRDVLWLQFGASERMGQVLELPTALAAPLGLTVA